MAATLFSAVCSRVCPSGKTASFGITILVRSNQAATTSTGDVTIKIITNGISPFWDPMAVGMERAAKELCCQATWAGPPTAQIPDQKRLIEDAISSKVDGLAVRVTASIGVATLPDVAGSAEELLRAADKAMYKVKNSGKDGVFVAVEE